MKLFIVDAFANNIFEGNQAGVILFENDENFPERNIMKNIAAELKHSETAFVKPLNDGKTFEIKFFTPNKEVELCGHATISVFVVLRNNNIITKGEYTAKTLAGNLKVRVESEIIWLQMSKGKVIKELTNEETEEIYNAYGLNICDKDVKIPCVVSNTGLSDILLPVRSREILNNANQNREKVIEISKKHNVAGIFMFSMSNNLELTAYTRSFAPLYGIDEECATGTATGALTYYLWKIKLIDNKIHKFIQGKATNRTSHILSRIYNDDIYIGGNGVISICGNIKV